MKAGIVLLIVGVLTVVILLVCAVVWGYQADKNCLGYLKLAGDAPTIEKCYEFLDRAIGYAELQGWTSGTTAIIFTTPDCDMGIWYGQLIGARETLNEMMNRQTTQLERDNALMKVREVVLDDGEKGTAVTHPGNISLWPSARMFFFLLVLSAVVAIIGIIIIVIQGDFC